MDNKGTKATVTEGMIIRLTFDGGFQRSKIYRTNVSEAKRREFSAYLTSELPRLLCLFKGEKDIMIAINTKRLKRFLQPWHTDLAIMRSHYRSTPGNVIVASQSFW